jgi:peptidoglycan/xylan/chitin deacetylase (PgdA/CDA1 family)
VSGLHRNSAIVPAVMFHSVGLENHAWAWSHLSESLEVFEAKIAALKEEGFAGIFWDDLYRHMSGEAVLPGNSILLTFDDGYLDNWVYVYPILRKYGMKGTIFMSGDFVDPAVQVRPNLDDLQAGRCGRDDLTVAGFLSWAEMREMEKSGIIDIQSHAMTHTWYFSGPRIQDYHRPHDVTPYPWLFWNAKPERKPFYLGEDQQEFVPWGYPLLEHEKSLVVRRFFPEESAVEEITAYVAANGGRDFFQDRGWRDMLRNKVASRFAGGILPGHFESDEAREARITHELRQSKRLIESNLGKHVEFICWPGGGNDPHVQDIAKAAGYKSWTLSSKSQLRKRNVPGADPQTIKRMGSCNVIAFRGRQCGGAGPRFFAWKVLEHQGSALHAAAAKAYKLSAVTLSLGGARP